MRFLGHYFPNRLEAALADHTVILMCGVYTSRLSRFIPQIFGCTCWSDGDPYVLGLTTSNVIESIDLIWLSKRGIMVTLRLCISRTKYYIINIYLHNKNIFLKSPYEKCCVNLTSFKISFDQEIT